jgi:endoglucanase
LGLALDRREFVLCLLSGLALPAIAEKQDRSSLHKMKGFNLQYYYKKDFAIGFSRSDIDFISEMGFGIVRVPFDYRVFFRSLDPVIVNPEFIGNLDSLIDVAGDRNIHVVLAMHRAPGYCVNPPFDNYSLWNDASVAKEFFAAWGYLSNRYAGSGAVSYNIINEPDKTVSSESYLEVLMGAIETIRRFDSRSVIWVDGLKYGSVEIEGLFGVENIIQSSRGYFPSQLTHWGADWMRLDRNINAVRWPIVVGGELIDRGYLTRRFELTWKGALQRRVPVSIGEWGVFNKVPHDVTIRFMRDSLEIYKGFGWGWMLWEFSGGFGVVNSSRRDVDYKNEGGYMVDKKMLNLLVEYL